MQAYVYDGDKALHCFYNFAYRFSFLILSNVNVCFFNKTVPNWLFLKKFLAIIKNEWNINKKMIWEYEREYEKRSKEQSSLF